MASPFKRAKREGINLRMALVGPTGSGKTMWGLKLAAALAGDGTPAVMDTENGSARRYADLLEFDAVEMTSFHPGIYCKGIVAAESHGYQALLIDSLSHAWAGKDGALAMVDKAAGDSKSGNSYVAWREVTPHHNAMVEAMLTCKLHLIVTMRAKTDYVMERDPKTGKNAPRKVGLQPVQRDGLEYEFDIIADVNMDHELVIGKTRCSALDKRVFAPGQLGELTAVLRAWVNGDPMPAGPGAEFDTPTEDEEFEGFTPRDAEELDEFGAAPEPKKSTPPAAVVPDDEFTQDDDDPFDEGDQPELTNIEDSPDGERHSDGKVVSRLMGGFDHCYKPADLKRWQTELAEARQSGTVTENGTALPELLKAAETAATRGKDAAKIAKAFEAVTTFDQLADADALFTAGCEGGLFKDGHDVTQSLTCRALKALARVTTDETFETLTDAIGSASDAGNLVEGTDFYAQVMTALAEADARCSEKVGV